MSHVTACSHVWLLLVIRVWYAVGSIALPACGSQPCADFEAGDGGQAGSAFSLLQVATTASRSMPERMRSDRNIVARGEDELDKEQHSLKQNRSNCVFPNKASSTYDVWNYFKKIGANETGFKLHSGGIDGKALWSMTLQDFLEYGMNDNVAQIFWDRLETAKAQKSIRQSVMDMAREGKPHKHEHWTLHNIVGPDGVLMITLDRESGRANHSATMLKQIGVNITKVSAVDSANASEEDLERGCRKIQKQASHRMKALCEYHKSTGMGCSWPSEQAVAASHRKALEVAKERAKTGAEWTAIFEDDAVPAPFDDWNLAFEHLWRKRPSRVKFMRLGWCQLGAMDWAKPINKVAFARTAQAVMVDRETFGDDMRVYEPGGCTTAYMVHKDILDNLLNRFPCCGPVDSCYKWDYFKAWDKVTKQERGLEVMMSMDSNGLQLWDGSVEHHGFILQDRRTFASAQDMDPNFH